MVCESSIFQTLRNPADPERDLLCEAPQRDELADPPGRAREEVTEEFGLTVLAVPPLVLPVYSRVLCEFIN